MNDTEDPSRTSADPQSPGEESVARLLRLAGPRPVAPDFRAARVREAAHARWRKMVTSGRRRRVFFWVAGALSSAAVLTLGIGLGRRSGLDGLFRPKEPIATLQRLEGSVNGSDARAFTVGEAVPPGTWLQTGRGGRAALLLAAGASLRVDEGTRLRLTSGSVLELAQGAVYVDTGSQAAARSVVEVHTKLGKVRDRGTQFEIRLEERAMRLSVREGIATLTREGQSYAARAGTRLSMDSQGVVEAGTVPLQGSDWDWVLAIAPAFALEGRTVGEFLGWVSRETGWEVRFADASVAREASTVVLHGSVARMRPDETPSAVLPTCGLRSRLVGTTLFVEVATSGGGLDGR